MVPFGSEGDSLIGLQMYLTAFGWLERTSEWFVDISKEEALFSIRCGGFLCLVISCNKWKLMGYFFLWPYCHQGPYRGDCLVRKVLSTSTVFLAGRWLSSML